MGAKICQGSRTLPSPPRVPLVAACSSTLTDSASNNTHSQHPDRRRHRHSCNDAAPPPRQRQTSERRRTTGHRITPQVESSPRGHPTCRHTEHIVICARKYFTDDGITAGRTRSLNCLSVTEEKKKRYKKFNAHFLIAPTQRVTKHILNL